MFLPSALVGAMRAAAVAAAAEVEGKKCETMRAGEVEEEAEEVEEAIPRQSWLVLGATGPQRLKSRRQ
jgi:hypothetical protein